MLLLKTVFGISQWVVLKYSLTNENVLNLLNYKSFSSVFLIKYVENFILKIDSLDQYLFLDIFVSKLCYGEFHTNNSNNNIITNNVKFVVCYSEIFYPSYKLVFFIRKTDIKAHELSFTNIFAFHFGRSYSLLALFENSSNLNLYKDISLKLDICLIPKHTKKLKNFNVKVKSLEKFNRFKISKRIQISKTNINVLKYHSTILELLGDIPTFNILPSDKIIFICKLSPFTNEEDLKFAFSKFGKIKYVKIIRDKISKKSLNYGFISYFTRKSCENAYFGSSNTIIDDCQVRVEFCQSVYRNNI